MEPFAEKEFINLLKQKMATSFEMTTLNLWKRNTNVERMFEQQNSLGIFFLLFERLTTDNHILVNNMKVKKNGHLFRDDHFWTYENVKQK